MDNCTHCGSDDLRKERKNEKQVGLYCNSCDKWLKWVSWDVARVYGGKYNGIAISEMTDLGYLKWAFNNHNGLSHKQRKAISKRILSLSNLYK